MSSGNSSILQTTEDFHCCCSITRNEFDANGTTGVHIFNSIVLVPTSILATVGNLLVLVSIWRTPSLHSPSNVLLFNLAVSDLGVGLAAGPTFIVHNIAKLKGLARVYCNSTITILFAACLFSVASLLTVTAISLDMYIALHLHLRYHEIVTVKRMTALIVSIWVFSLTGSLFYVWFWHHLRTFSLFLVPLCLLVTTFAYYRVFLIVRHHQNQIHAQAKVQEQAKDQEEDPTRIAQQKKCLMNKFLVYCLLVICYLPFVVMTVVLRTTSFSVIKQALYEISVVGIHLNSTLNPCVYCWRFQTIRAAVNETTKKILRRQDSRKILRQNRSTSQ